MVSGFELIKFSRQRIRYCTMLYTSYVGKYLGRIVNSMRIYRILFMKCIVIINRLVWHKRVKLIFQLQKRIILPESFFKGRLQTLVRHSSKRSRNVVFGTEPNMKKLKVAMTQMNEDLYHGSFFLSIGSLGNSFFHI